MKTKVMFLALCAIILVFSGAVSAADAPTANFTSNVTNGSAPLSIQFNDTSTGNATSWNWDFGDNETSTEQNPSHIYTHLGNYSVKLNASNSEGSSIKTNMIYVTNASEFTYYRDWNIYVANDEGVKYDVENGVVNTNSAGITYTYVNGTYFVNFRQDNGGLNPLHISTSNSSYQVTNTDNQSGTFYLTFTGGQPTMPEAILMLAINGTISPKFTVHITSSGYTWDLCVPSIHNNDTITNLTYVAGAVNETFDASDLIYTSYYKLCSSADYPIYYGINTAELNDTFRIMFIDLYAGCLRSGIDNGALKVDYSFTGLTSENTAVFNVYGWYSASEHGTGIIMTNNLIGGTSSGYSVQGVDPPVANFISNTTSGLNPLSVQFTDLSTGNATSWFWDFGDGSNSTEQNPAHTYELPGNYSVTLTAINAGGNNTLTQTGYITVFNSTPPTLNASADSGVYNGSINVSLTSDQADSTIYYTTDGSDPTDSANTSRVPYSGAIPITNTTNLQYAAVNAGGVWSSRSSKNYIIDTSSPNVTATPTSGLFNTTITVTLNASDADSNTTIYYTLDETDPQNSSTRIVYSTPITISYTTTLKYIAVDQANNWSPECSQTYNLPPVVNFTANATSGFPLLNIQFNDTSTDNATAWYWDFGDGSTSTEQNPIHTYIKTGTYAVTLTATNTAGNNTLTKINYIAVLANDVYVSSTGNDTTGDGTALNPFATIQTGLLCTADGGILHIMAGTYSGAGNANLTINKNITIIGENQNSTIIDAERLNRIFVIDSGINVTMENLTLVNGTTNVGGGAIYSEASLTINNCTLTGNSLFGTYGIGGAIFNGGSGTFTMSNCTLTDNDAVTNGGAIANSGTFTMSNCTFTNNSANLFGAIYNNYGTFSIIDCTFINNTAGSGGAIGNSQSIAVLNLINCNFMGNTAQTGGAIFNGAGATLTVTNCTFQDNVGRTSTGAGAAIYNKAGTLSLLNNTFTNNTAGYWGGAIYNKDTITLLSNCAFVGNTATNQGGAIYDSKNMNLSDCAFVGNTATYGGAIYYYITSTSATVSMTGCNFMNNAAINQGGAIYVSSKLSTIPVNFSSFVNNTATSGSAIYSTRGAVNAINNWWGSNNDPSSQVYGSVDCSNWLYMTITANPSGILSGSAANVTVNFNNIFDGSIVSSIDPAVGHILDGTVVSFSSLLGSFSPVTTVTTNGVATAVFAATTSGYGAINATTDYQIVSTNIAVDVALANFTANATTGNNSMSVQFNDTSLNNPTSWVWDFGDGSSSTEQNPVHQYNRAGNYTVTLTALNSYGNTTKTKTSYICIIDTIPMVSADVTGGLYNTTQIVSLTTDDNTATIYYSLDGSASTKYTGPITINSTSRLSYLAVDIEGNLSPIYTENYVIDTVVPTASVNVTGGLFNSMQLVSLLSDDSNATIYYTLDGSTPDINSAKYTAAINIANSTTLKFIVVDDAGNWSPVYTENYVIDTVVPTASVNVTGGLFNSMQLVSLLSDDSNATIYYTLDGFDPTNASTKYTDPININSTTTLKFTAVDSAGNWSPVYTENYVIDTVVPTASANVTSGLFNSVQLVSLTAVDDSNTTIYYTLDGSAPDINSTKYTGPISINSTTTLKFVAVDDAGNMGSVYTEEYVIDTVAPTGNASVTGGIFNVNQSVVLSADDSNATIYYTLDGSNPTNVSTKYTDPISINSSATLKFVVVDPAGNYSPVYSETYTIDTVAPNASVNVASGLYNSDRTIVLKMSEVGAIYYTLDGSTPTLASKKYTGTFRITSSKTLRFMAVDLAGNVSPVYTTRYTIDKVAPKVTSTNPKSKYRYFSRTKALTFRFSEKISKTINWSKVYVKNLKTGKKISIKKWIRGNVLYIKASKRLYAKRWYAVYIPRSAVKDKAGNKLARYFVLKFRTR